MAVLEPHYSKEEFARRRQTIYERDIRPNLMTGDEGKLVAIDIETGTYEIDRDDYTATERLLGHHPNAQICLLPCGASCRIPHWRASKADHWGGVSAHEVRQRIDRHQGDLTDFRTVPS